MAIRDSKSAQKKSAARKATVTAAAQRRIQQKVDQKDARQGGKKKEARPAQTGARKYPEPPFPKQHLPKPEEIAPAYVFLASQQCSSYITGEILPIIGGYNGG